MNSKKIWTYFFGGAVIVIIISMIIRTLTPSAVKIPQTEFISTNTDGSTTHFKNIIFTGKTIEPPRELPVAIGSQVVENDNFFINRLTNNYQLKTLEGAENIWSGPDYSLSKSTATNQFILSKNSFPPYRNDLELARTLKAASNYLQTTFPEITVYPQSSWVKFFKAGPHLEETDPNNSGIIEIPFSFQIEGLPVFFEHYEDFPFKVMINADYQLQKLTFQPVVATFEVVSTNQTISLEEALININNNQASIVSAYEPISGIFKLEDIESGKLTSVTIEYRLDNQTNYAYPFYKFAGLLINDNQQEITAEIITPAIKITPQNN